MEELREKKEGDGCACGMCHGCGRTCCGWGRMHRFLVLRTVLLLVILGVVFTAGVKLGEFKTRFSGSYGMRGGYQRYFDRFDASPYPNFYYGPGMMNRNNFIQPSATSTR